MPDLNRLLTQAEQLVRERQFARALALARAAGEQGFAEVFDHHLPILTRGREPRDDLLYVDWDALSDQELYLVAKHGGYPLDPRVCTNEELRRLNAGEDWRVIQAEHEARAPQKNRVIDPFF
jgi:hypothetical protein